MDTSNLTPLMKQFWEIKSLHADKILLFRMGDFFEMFHDDAVQAAPILGVALTQRNKKSQDETPMCGVPHHSIAGPINKLLSRGLKVAICDQIEDPKLAKGLVKRAVTRILTPGMVFDPDTLDSRKPHYLASWDEEGLISFLDTTTGEGFCLKAKTAAERKSYLETLSVAEVVLAGPEVSEFQTWGIRATLSQHEDYLGIDHLLLKDLIENKNISEQSLSLRSVRRLLSYVQKLSGEEGLRSLAPFQFRELHRRLNLGPTVLRHLEIFKNYKGEENGSFFNAIDRTRTSTGCRLLRQWVSFPLTNLEQIEKRQEKIHFWQQDLHKLEKVRQVLGNMGDLERRFSKVAQVQCNGRDLQSFSVSLRAGLESIAISSYLPLEMNLNAGQQQELFEKLQGLILRVETSLLETQPLSTKQGHLIQRGLSPVLDELIDLSTNSQDLLAKMEKEEREKTGISTLKIRYNNVFGYYIEITHVHRDKVPVSYHRKQTLANAERYCTDELIALERKILSAQTKRAELESEIFEELRRFVLTLAPEILQLARICSELDVMTSLAFLSLEQNYVCPQIGSYDQGIQLVGSRHPVIEQVLKKEFVPNDIYLKNQACLLLTGPNMAGKSTLMRQVALTLILAQIGSFIPAQSALIGVRDGIFTRIGASDMLTEGLSTFMVEMSETAQILKEVTNQSLVILDEIGRGTSTYDGMALAQSILEFLLTEKKCLTMFATHYHELTHLADEFPQISNGHMAITEQTGDIRFLHTLVKGAAMKSYGVHVAHLAGLPTAVTKRARGLLKQLEKEKVKSTSQMSFVENLDFDEDRDSETRGETWLSQRPTQFSRNSPSKSHGPELSAQFLKVVNAIKSCPVTGITPLEALSKISQWQEEFRQVDLGLTNPP